jgi:hypothetical protein
LVLDELHRGVCIDSGVAPIRGSQYGVVKRLNAEFYRRYVVLLEQGEGFFRDAIRPGGKPYALYGSGSEMPAGCREQRFLDLLPYGGETAAEESELDPADSFFYQWRVFPYPLVDLRGGWYGPGAGSLPLVAKNAPVGAAHMGNEYRYCYLFFCHVNYSQKSKVKGICCRHKYMKLKKIYSFMVYATGQYG